MLRTASLYPLSRELERRLPSVSERSRRGLALWVKGTLLVGAGAAFGEKPLPDTLMVLHAQGHKAPWLLLTDTPPDRTDVDLYACRHWIEQGFRGLKRGGWQWHRTRRRDPVRVARHLLARNRLWVRVWLTPVPDPDLAGGLHCLSPPVA